MLVNAIPICIFLDITPVAQTYGSDVTAMNNDVLKICTAFNKNSPRLIQFDKDA